MKDDYQWPAIRLHVEPNGSSGGQVLVDVIVSVEARPGIWVPVFRKYAGGKCEVHLDDHVLSSEHIAERVRVATDTSAHYLTNYVVEGEEHFPYDLLRVTQSWPADESDAKTMARPLDGYRKRRVELVTRHYGPTPQLHRERWDAMDWRVVRVTTTKLP